MHMLSRLLSHWFLFIPIVAYLYIVLGQYIGLFFWPKSSTSLLSMDSPTEYRAELKHLFCSRMSLLWPYVLLCKAGRALLNTTIAEYVLGIPYLLIKEGIPALTHFVGHHPLIRRVIDPLDLHKRVR